MLIACGAVVVDVVVLFQVHVRLHMLACLGAERDRKILMI